MFIETIRGIITLRIKVEFVLVVSAAAVLSKGRVRLARRDLKAAINRASDTEYWALDQVTQECEVMPPVQSGPQRPPKQKRRMTLQAYVTYIVTKLSTS